MTELALLLHTLLFVGVVFMLARRGYMNIYSGLFIYCGFHFMAFVQRPIVVHLFDIRSEFIFMSFWPTQDEVLQTLLASDIGLLAFCWAYAAALRFAPPRPSFLPPTMGPTERRAAGLAALILSPLIGYSFFLAFTVRQQYGTEVLQELGRLNMTIDPLTGAALFADTTAYVVFARNMALPLCTVLIVATRGAAWSYLPLALCALVPLQLGERWPFVIAVLATVLLALYLRRRRTFRAGDYALMAGILAVFMQLGQNRSALIRFILTGEVDLEFDLRKTSFGEHPDFANFEFLSYVIAKVPAVSRTYTYFTQYLGLFTQPIPRVIWPDKPVGPPLMLVNLQAYGRFASRTPSAVGDGWMSLGHLGVAVTLAAGGYAYGRLFRAFCAPGARSAFFFCAYFWILALLLQWARDGGYKIFDFVFFCVGPLLFAALLAVLLQPGTAPQARAR